jgi:hypothetical protein
MVEDPWSASAAVSREVEAEARFGVCGCSNSSASSSSIGAADDDDTAEVG